MKAEFSEGLRLSKLEYLEQPLKDGRMNKETAKSFPISRVMVMNSYKKVVEKDGGAGIDKVSIKEFDVHWKDNLYKIWNRMASGSYFPPPVRTVFIPKKQGGERALGIPTVGDRIAQGVVKDYLEPITETFFHSSSFGYRPKKGALEAVRQCQESCQKWSWVLDVDIKGFFDNLDHSIMMDLLRRHTQEKWVLLYVERWLKAGVEQKDGGIKDRTKGTPQGGVISPVLANLYLHHAFDGWLGGVHPNRPFERYADDIVVHCASEMEAEELLKKLHERMAGFGLELHPEKTKIVYCKNDYRKGEYENNSFVFLGYSFQPRVVISVKGGDKKKWVVFSGGICSKAKTSIRSAIKETVAIRWVNQKIEIMAAILNPKLRGWTNYYCKYNKHETYKVLQYLNEQLRSWIRNVYRLRGNVKVYAKFRQIQSEKPNLFYHWQLGIK